MNNFFKLGFVSNILCLTFEMMVVKYCHRIQMEWSQYQDISVPDPAYLNMFNIFDQCKRLR